MDDIDVQLEKIEALYVSAEYEQTYKNFLFLCKSDPDFYEQAKAILSNFKDIENQWMIGNLDRDNYLFERRKIGNRFQMCLKQFRESHYNNHTNFCVHKKEDDSLKECKDWDRETRIEITDRFPYPIVSVFSRLHTKQGRTPGRDRLNYILDTAEAIARYLGIVLMCECRQYLEEQYLKPPEFFANSFQKHFSHPTFESWLNFSQKSLQLLNSCSNVRATLSMSELTNFFFTQISTESKAASALNRLSDFRKEFSHEKIKAMPESECYAPCKQTFPLLYQVVESLKFLLKYELAFVCQIEVTKPRKGDPCFDHQLKRLTGESLKEDSESSQNTMDSTSILLRNIKTGESLNLDPLLVYEKDAGEAEDIFFYNGEKQEGTEYSACKHGGNFFAKNSKRFETIIKEINNFKTLFTVPHGNLGGGQ